MKLNAVEYNQFKLAIPRDELRALSRTMVQRLRLLTADNDAMESSHGERFFYGIITKEVERDPGAKDPMPLTVTRSYMPFLIGCLELPVQDHPNNDASLLALRKALYETELDNPDIEKQVESLKLTVPEYVPDNIAPDGSYIQGDTDGTVI